MFLSSEFLFWGLAVGLVLYRFVPLVVYFQSKHAAHPRLEVLDLHRLTAPIRQFLMRQTEALFALGFDEPTLIHIPDATPNVQAYLVLLVNRQSGDKAMVTALVGDFNLRTLYLEFSTRLETGEVFDTMNFSDLCAFPTDSKQTRTQVPMVRDPGELCRLHTFIMKRQGLSGRKVLFEPGQARDYLIHYAFVLPYTRLAERGWFYYDSATDCYRATLKGAYLMTWGLMQPFKAFRKVIMYRRARKILQEFRYADDWCAHLRTGATSGTP